MRCRLPVCPRSCAVSTLAFVLAIALSSACGPPQERPPGVPSDFVATPLGWYHPDCVIEVADGEVVGEVGEVVGEDGAVRAVGACGRPRYDKLGRQIDGKLGVVPTVTGWVSSVWSMPGPVGSFSVTWTVPSAPAVIGGQTVFLFPGLEPLATGDRILQPVLAWNGFADRRWTIASWHAALDRAFHSAPRRVQPGETITGSMTGAKCDARGACAAWTVRTTGTRAGSTTLRTDANGLVLDWAFGGALEVVGLDVCGHFPPEGKTKFRSISVRSPSGVLATPAWVPAAGGIEPGCNTGAAADAGGASVTLTWTTAP
jgi:hypothetical protein